MISSLIPIPRLGYDTFNLARIATLAIQSSDFLFVSIDCMVLQRSGQQRHVVKHANSCDPGILKLVFGGWRMEEDVTTNCLERIFSSLRLVHGDIIAMMSMN